MKKKNGALEKSAVSELLLRQSRNEEKAGVNESAAPRPRRGYIETLDSDEMKKSGLPAKNAAVRAEQRTRPNRTEVGAAPVPDKRISSVKPDDRAATDRKAMRVGGAAVKKTAKIAHILIAATAIICLCTVIISAVLINDGDSAELRSDAVLGEMPDIAESEIARISGNTITADDETATEELHRVDFTFYKKDTVSCYTSERTVGELVELLGIQLDESETARVDLGQVVSADTEVNVDCVEYAADTVSATVAYETRYVDVQTIPRGSTKVYQQGKNGSKNIEYKVTYLNGIECDREQTGEYITVAPTECIVYRGVGGTVNVGGTTRSYSYYIDCRSTVYTGGGTCATGVPASENVIAVDPRVIPLGTNVYIEGVGMRTAADTGGSIKGNFIDIYYEPGNTRFVGYGIKNVRVYIF